MFWPLTSFRRLWLFKKPFPNEWDPILQEKVPFFNRLDPEEKKKFRKYLKVFIWEKTFIPAGGIELTDEMMVLISSAAVRLVFHLGLGHYDRLSEIYIYPGAFINPQAEGGALLGEASHWGSVVLSWESVKIGMEREEDGNNTAYHEFAHVLDRYTGAFDGTPELHDFSHYAPWAKIMSKHFLKLRKRGKSALKVLDDYGSINEAEFFAVATEAFFETPEKMKKHMPELYSELSRFYQMEPSSSN